MQAHACRLAYEETTASSLLTIDLEGNVIHPGVVGDIFGVNHAGYVIHSALHRARPDAIAVMHSHFAPATGISAQRDGLKARQCQPAVQAGPQACMQALHGVNRLMLPRLALAHSMSGTQGRGAPRNRVAL